MQQAGMKTSPGGRDVSVSVRVCEEVRSVWKEGRLDRKEGHDERKPVRMRVRVCMVVCAICMRHVCLLESHATLEPATTQQGNVCSNAAYAPKHIQFCQSAAFAAYLQEAVGRPPGALHPPTRQHKQLPYAGV